MLSSKREEMNVWVSNSNYKLLHFQGPNTGQSLQNIISTKFLKINKPPMCVSFCKSTDLQMGLRCCCSNQPLTDSMWVFYIKITKLISDITQYMVTLKSNLEQCSVTLLPVSLSLTADLQKDSGGGCPIIWSCSIMKQNDKGETANKNATKSMLSLDYSQPDGTHGGSFCRISP